MVRILLRASIPSNSETPTPTTLALTSIKREFDTGIWMPRMPIPLYRWLPKRKARDEIRGLISTPNSAFYASACFFPITVHCVPESTHAPRNSSVETAWIVRDSEAATNPVCIAFSFSVDLPSFGVVDCTHDWIS